MELQSNLFGQDVEQYNMSYGNAYAYETSFVGGYGLGAYSGTLIDTFGYGDYDEENESLIEASSVQSETVLVKGDMEWNERFQRALEQPTRTPEEIAERIHTINDITTNFVEFVVPIAKKIILEEELGKNKTIPALTSRGIAGGEKYIYQGVFFKFSRDNMGLYGSNHPAKKVAGLDVDALQHIIKCNIPGLHFPLTVLIDYMGRRLIANSILPITDSTIIYGSADAAKTVYNSSKEFNFLAEQLAQKLNLKSHPICSGSGKKTIMHGPFDMEGHAGKDGRFYILDFSRLFPPVPPTLSAPLKSSHLYQLFRGELVKKHSVPLSPDAYMKCGMSRHDIDDIKDAVGTIFALIPQVIKKLQKVTIEQINNSPLMFKHILHEEGINIRYIGMIHEHMIEEDKISPMNEYIAAEILYRSLKHQISTEMEKTSTLLSDCQYNIITHHLSLFFSIDTPLLHYCRQNLKKFISLLGGHYLLTSWVPTPSFPFFWIFRRITDGLGVMWDECLETCFSIFREKPYAISGDMIVGIEAKVKAIEILSDEANNDGFYDHQILIRKKRLGLKHPLVADSLENQAEMCLFTNFSLARENLQEAVTIRESFLCHLKETGLKKIYFLHYFSSFGNEELHGIKLGVVYKKLAKALHSGGCYQDALLIITKGLIIFQKFLQPNHFHIAESFLYAGWILKDIGKYSEAATYLERAITMAQNSEHVVMTRLLLGSALVERGRISLHQYKHDEALTYQTEALHILEDAIGPNHSRLGTICNNLAISYCIQKEFGKSLSFAKRGLSIRAAKLGKFHQYVAHSLCSIIQIRWLSNCYYGKEIPEEIPFLAALELPSTIYQAHSKRHMATIKLILGRYYHRLKQWEQAEGQLLRVQNTIERYYGSSHISQAASFTYRSALLLDHFIHTGDKNLLTLALQFAFSANTLFESHSDATRTELLFIKHLIRIIMTQQVEKPDQVLVDLTGFHFTQSLNVSMLFLFYCPS